MKALSVLSAMILTPTTLLQSHIGTKAFLRAGQLAKRAHFDSCPVAALSGRPHSILRVEIQSIRAVATGSMARLSHQATSSPKLWMSR